jgi:hypothetical protein
MCRGHRCRRRARRSLRPGESACRAPELVGALGLGQQPIDLGGAQRALALFVVIGAGVEFAYWFRWLDQARGVLFDQLIVDREIEDTLQERAGLLGTRKGVVITGRIQPLAYQWGGEIAQPVIAEWGSDIERVPLDVINKGRCTDIAVD